MQGWHFIQNDRAVRRYTDSAGRVQAHAGVVVVPGQTLSVCSLIGRGSVLNDPTFARGLFASVTPAEALFHAPGLIVCRVQLAGQMIRHEHYAQAEQRTCLWMADATQAVWMWAVWRAAKSIERAQQAGHTVDGRIQAAVRARYLWLRGARTEAECLATRNPAKQAMRRACGQDARGDKLAGALSTPLVANAARLAVAVADGQWYLQNGFATGAPGHYDTPEGVAENRKLETLLLALEPKR